MVINLNTYNFEIPYLKGRTHLVLDPVALPGDIRKWFINDHCIFTGPDGKLHFFGINNPFPEDMTHLYRIHRYITHAVADTPTGGFEICGFALEDETWLGAPAVQWCADKKKFVMLLQSDIAGIRGQELAFSKDLYSWQRTGVPVLENIGIDMRDPCFVALDNGNTGILLATTQDQKNSCVLLVETKNFDTFTEPVNLFSIADNVPWGGIESPFLYFHKELWYLFFTYAHHQYYETRVLVSDTPYHFKCENQITTLFGHASEIFAFNGKEYITNCGPGDAQVLNEHALYVTELCWLKP